jgi:hypothetical protein
VGFAAPESGKIGLGVPAFRSTSSYFPGSRFYDIVMCQCGCSYYDNITIKLVSYTDKSIHPFGMVVAEQLGVKA